MLATCVARFLANSVNRFPNRGVTLLTERCVTRCRNNSVNKFPVNNVLMCHVSSAGKLMSIND